MAAVVRIVALMWVDILAAYAMFVLMEYLTDVWKLGYTHAAAIINIFWGAVLVSQLLLAFIVDTITGDYWMLLLSTLSYTAGLGFLAMSTPPVLPHSCKEYKPECIGEGQKVLFYIALPLIAFGMSGHLTSWTSFMAQQLIGEEEEEGELHDRTFWKFFGSITSTTIFTTIATFALPYIKPWSLRFGIPAICTLVSALLFFSGSCSYRYFRPQGSPLTMFARVFVAALSKLFYKVPGDAKELYEIQNPQFYTVLHTTTLRCLDKAAVVIPTKPLEEQESNPWRLCTVTEVEETKTIVRMIPVWTTFILCGVTSCIGLTFFVEQLNHLNHRVGKIKIPSAAIIFFLSQAQNQCGKLYIKLVSRCLGESKSRKYGPSLGIVASIILCCITAAKVEDRRLGIVHKHGLVDKPDETVPMTMFWLLPQFILLGAYTGIFSNSATLFFIDQSPEPTRRYLPFFINFVFGVGVFCSVLSVFVVGKATNWFQHELNASRVDKYFWTLGGMMGVNLVIFIVMAMLYLYKELELLDHETGITSEDINEMFQIVSAAAAAGLAQQQQQTNGLTQVTYRVEAAPRILSHERVHHSRYYQLSYQ